MPSDKCNSRTARARDLISSLINVIPSQDVPFHQPRQLQCLHYGATFILHWSPILPFFSYSHFCTGQKAPADCARGWSLFHYNHTLRLINNYSSQPHKVTIWGRHAMASVRDIKIAEALLILWLAYYVVKKARHCWNWGVMAFIFQDMGSTFHEYVCPPYFL